MLRDKDKPWILFLYSVLLEVLVVIILFFSIIAEGEIIVPSSRLLDGRHL
jgi:hypothetical protein